MVCEQLNGENKSHKFKQSDGVARPCVAAFFSYYQIIFHKSSFLKFHGEKEKKCKL